MDSGRSLLIEPFLCASKRRQDAFYVFTANSYEMYTITYLLRKRVLKFKSFCRRFVAFFSHFVPLV